MTTSKTPPGPAFTLEEPQLSTKMDIIKVGFTWFAVLPNFWGKEWCESCFDSVDIWKLTDVHAGLYNGWPTGRQKRNIGTFNKHYKDTYYGVSGSWIRLNDAIEKFNEVTYKFNLEEQSSCFLNQYHEGYVLDWHKDNDESVEDLFKRRPSARISVSIFLNEDFEGGEFELQGINKFPAKTGTAIIFPSAQVHRGCQIRKGTKYNLTYWRKGWSVS